MLCYTSLVMRGSRLAAGVLAVAALATVSAACVVAPVTPPPRGILMSRPPPEAIPEDRPPPPVALATWVAGYWHWNGVQYVWIPGHWDTSSPGETWRAPTYTQSNGSVFYEPGGWGPARPAGSSGSPASPATSPGATPPSVEAFH